MCQMTEPEKATEWLLALKDNPDDTKLKADFTRWYDQTPEHARDWIKTVHTYKLMGETTPEFTHEWAPQTTTNNTSIHPGTKIDLFKKKKWTGLAIAASLLLIALFTETDKGTADFSTGQGENRSINLADGSRVYLGPHSRLNIDYTDRYRGVKLLEGQAFFEVAKKVEHPFRVMANGTQISVLGTAFDVNLSNHQTAVKVKEGVVRVKPDFSTQEDEILKKGDGISVATDGSYKRFIISTDYVAAWREGRFVVNDRPAGEVIDTLRRYYNGIVLVHGEGLENQPVSGMYLLDKPDIALKAVGQTIGAKTYQMTPWMLVISAN